ncbi:MAG: protein-glutamate O-methyltransferase CheR [Candidatus Riflebacteria bacterium]|nr:protein-glutamate O-methyltransferase CheR [Candidatus Riflebacteria bacterium]
MSDRISGRDYIQLRDFLSREFGLFFEPSKVTFLENRLLPLLAEMRLESLNDMISCVRTDFFWRGRFLDALTTNETWFFRHPRHFDILREDILPALVRERAKSRRREIEIWSAGCSIGAEACSIAITMHEVLQDAPDWSLRIIGSDVSPQAITRAHEGIYTGSEVRLLSGLLLNRYFMPVDDNNYKIKPELQNLITYEIRNLLEEPWPDREFDVIFCRNTMIYFKDETKAKLTERFYKALRTGGIFIPGATETIHWVGNNEFEREFIRGEYIYRKRMGNNEYILYQFVTSSDLLRALNILVKEHFEYRLQTITQMSHTSPKKALIVPIRFIDRVERLFSDALLKPLLRENVSQ